MSIIGLIFILIVIGLALWAANTYIPMDPKIKGIMNVVVVLLVLLWLASVFFPGWYASSPAVRPIVPMRHASVTMLRLVA
jgi:low temperature requirement protein LtrA